jgi:hypothetical protein
MKSVPCCPRRCRTCSPFWADRSARRRRPQAQTDSLSFSLRAAVRKRSRLISFWRAGRGDGRGRFPAAKMAESLRPRLAGEDGGGEASTLMSCRRARSAKRGPMMKLGSMYTEWWSREVACVTFVRRIVFRGLRKHRIFGSHSEPPSEETNGFFDSDWKLHLIAFAVAVLAGLVLSPFAIQMTGVVLVSVLGPLFWLIPWLYCSCLSFRFFKRSPRWRGWQVGKTSWTAICLFSWCSPTMLAAWGLLSTVGGLFVYGPRETIGRIVGIPNNWVIDVVIIMTLFAAWLTLLLALYASAVISAASRADDAATRYQ